MKRIIKKKLLSKFFRILLSLTLIFQSIAPWVIISNVAYAQESTSSAGTETQTTEAIVEEDTTTTETTTEETQADSTTTSEPEQTTETTTNDTSDTATTEPTTEVTEPTDTTQTSTTEPTTEETTQEDAVSEEVVEPETDTAEPADPETTEIEITTAPTEEPIVEETVVEEPTVVVEEIPTETGNEELATVVVANTSAESLDDLNLDAETVMEDPTVVTDKGDYAPTDAAVISGTGFEPNTDYTIIVSSEDDPATSTSDTVTTDDNGGFVYTYQLDGIYRHDYKVEIYNGEELVASTTFTDAAIGTYDQCSNDDGDGYATGDTGCRWINGNLVESNSVYYEHDATPQRLWLEGFVPGSTHSVTFKYGTTKSGNHAYDYLTNWNHSENWITVPDRCDGIDGCTTASETTTPMQVDPNAGGFDSEVRNFVLRGGTLNSATVPVIVSGSYAADSETAVTVSFTVSASGDMCETKGQTTTCGVAIWFGAHIAAEIDWGVGNGATAIPGSPYHVSLDAIDGSSAGERDNQMQSATIVVPQQATLTLLKTVINDNGGTAVDTAWTLSANGPTPISGVEGNASVTSALVDAGDYTLSESGGPSNYTATLYSCVVNGGAPVVSNSLTLVPEDDATCTITNNDNAPQLHLRKTVTNDNGGTALNTAWTLTATGTGGTPTNLSGSTPVDSGASFKADTYALAETSGPAGYTAGTWNCGGATMSDATHVTVSLGGDVTCTINNNDNAPSLHLRKIITNDNGGSATVADFTLTANGTGSNDISGTSPVDSGAGLLADTFALSESSVAGYSASAWSCVGGTQNGSNITIALGESSTCTITNNDIAPTLKLVKVVTNNNGGGAVASDWDLTATGGGDGFTDDGGTGGFHNVTAGQGYVLSESSVTGYAQDGSWSCTSGSLVGSTITLGLNQNVTCTIVNNDQAAHLIVIKHVINDNGGTAVAGDFTTTITGVTTTSQSAAGVESPGVNNVLTTVGGYSVDEGAHVGYTKTLSADCSGTIALGQTKTCTITNNDIAPVLHLRKVVINDNGGSATTSDFTLTANGTGSNDLSGTSPVDSGETLKADTFALGETSVTGYTASAWVCVGGTQNGSNITVGLNEEATCTITNTDNIPSLHLRKVVVNDNGGTALDTAWTLSANGPTPLSGTTPVDSGAAFSQGSYALSESGPAGYTASAWVCVGGTQVGSDITVALGESATCTITNDDNAPSLTLIKAVTNNNGGTAVPANWTLTATGPTGFSGAGPTVNNGASFDSGSYDLSELGPEGYTASDWVCVGGTQNDSNTVTVGLGQSATCTIINDDISPTLTLVKTVVNDNGGTALATDWTLLASGPTGFSGAGPTVNNGASFDSGTYALSESGPAGYSASAWVCVGGTQNGSNITVGLGQSATCTITNDDNAPALHLRKVVVNDNGGTALATDWTLSASGPTPLSGTTPVDSGASFDQGTYALSELGPVGYTASGWVCVGGTQDESNITLGLGESATCTITNNDIAPILHLRKIVVNDNGGTALATDWTLTANGTGANDLSGTTPVDSGATLKADTFALGETGPANYTASAWVCVGGTQNGSNITLGLAGEATCTITNNDDVPALHLRKVVINDNGGTAVDTAWTLTATGPTGISGSTPVDSGASFDHGTYALSESGPAGYSASAWVCVGGTQNGSNITVGLGQSATCTITNDDIAPILHLRKLVVNDHGGTATVANFTLTANGTGANDLSGTSPVDSGAGLKADTFALSETSVAGYAASAWVCVGGTQNGASITLGLAQEATCTITNDDIQPKLTLIKHVINNNGGTLGVSDFPLFVDATGVTSGVENGFNAGSYTASETTQTGYSASVWSGDCAANGSVTLAVGDDKTCEITNNDISPTLTIIKDAQPNDLINFAFSGTLGAFSLDDDAGVLGEDNALSNTRVFTNINAGNTTVTETQPNSFWLLQSATCVDGQGQPFASNLNGTSLTFNLPLASNVTCTFVNFKASPTRTQGFWQTHTAYTNSVFETYFSGGMQIGSGIHRGLITNTLSTGQSQLYGAFYSNIAKKTNNQQRTALDKARMQLLQQLVAAKLNCAAFGCSSSVQTTITNADSAYASGPASLILIYVTLLDNYNNSGDTITIGPAGKATPKTSQSLANKAFWDLP